MRHVVRRGRVYAGLGGATRDLAPLTVELTSYFGKQVCPGTLNVVLDWPIALDKALAVRFGSNPNIFWPVTCQGQPCLIRRWPNCPLHLAEIVSPFHLRTALNLRGGDRVEIGFAAGDVAPLSVRRRLIWTILWLFRRSTPYTNRPYVLALRELNPAAYRLASQDGD